MNAIKIKKLQSVINEFNMSAMGEEQVMMGKMATNFEEPRLKFSVVEDLISKKLD